jgi:hypothetical protein
MIRRVLATGVLAAGLLVTGAGAASAQTLSPWYSVSATDLPGVVQPGIAKDSIVELSASATSGDVFIAENTQLQEVLDGKLPFEDLSFAIFPYDANAQEVQEALEQAFPEHRVTVAEGKGDTADSHSWTATFPGQSIGAIFVNGQYAPVGGGPPLECEEGLAGCTASASALALAAGQADGEILVSAVNVGDGTANLYLGRGGTSLQVSQTLPPGVQATFINGALFGHEEYNGNGLGVGHSPAKVRCDVSTLTCTFSETKIPPFLNRNVVYVRIGVKVTPGAGGAGVTTVSGGGSSRTASVSHTIALAQAPGEATPFGAEEYEMRDEEAGGASDTQAGSHPFQTTFTLNFNRALEEEEQQGSEITHEVPAQLTKDLNFNLPPGWVADPSALPHCTLAQFFAAGNSNECPADTVIGMAVVTLLLSSQAEAFAQPVYNLETSVGEPARFGFEPASLPVLIGASVRTGGDYGVTAHVYNITQLSGFMSQTVTFWGVPGAASHDSLRGYGCLRQLEFENGEAERGAACESGPPKPPPFITMPTTCAGELVSSVEGDSWQESNQREVEGLPERLRPLASDDMGGLDGCADLPFAPEIKVTPDSKAASTPSGLNVDVHIPQEGVLNGSGLAPADVRKIEVALPEGVALNPSAGDGLQACPLLTGHGQEAAEERGEVSGINLETRQPADCPNASKIATATIKTPLLPNPLKGFAYLAQPESFSAFTQGLAQNPFGSLVAMYFAVSDPVSGVLIKLAGQVALGPEGQIVSTFANDPPEPFEDAEIHFFGGERAPLGTPTRCGAYTTGSTFEPWTNHEGYERVVHASSTFEMTAGPDHTPCPGSSLPFSPSLTAGTTSNQAGGFSPFTLTMSREDGEQSLSSIELRMPPGLSGTLSNVKLCGEAQANEGTCPEDTLIGETIVSVGLGGDPFSVKGGKVYLTGPYHGGSFGLSIVNPAKAGPFDLENTTRQHPACDCIVVRAKIQVDPVTAALTITSNPPGTQYSIPTSIEGIPLEIQHVNVTINHLEQFTFNPTNCNKLQVTGTLFSTEGAQDQLSVPFQATNCAALGFKPQFAVSTEGKTSRARGASLTAKLSYPNVGGHSVLATGLANIAKVKVELPRQLPSRLSTLQKACTVKVFDANPAGCPVASRIGYATATTPLLPEKLTGPAYFVSNGGTKFPELIVVLQGYGVTVDLHGETFISKSGITSSTFATVPDVPVGTFELTLPEGPSSALGATTNLCKAKLVMPTLFVAQNGAQIHQNTPITVTGCKKTIRVIKHKKNAKRRIG